jgi:hypothetical protein
MYLLDTNVVSEFRKIPTGKADASVVAWADSVDAADLYLSVITVQELEIGVLYCAHGLSTMCYPLLQGEFCPSIWRWRNAAHACMCPIPKRFVIA